MDMKCQIHFFLAGQLLAKLLIYIDLYLLHTGKFLLTDGMNLLIENTVLLIRQLIAAHQTLGEQAHMSSLWKTVQ